MLESETHIKVSPALLILFTISALLYGHLATAAEAKHKDSRARQLTQSLLACGPFTAARDLPTPALQSDEHAVKRFHRINEAVKQDRYSVIFFGDSLTEDWDPGIWEQYLAPYRALNAGIRGDRTEHLLWRLQHGNMDGQSPSAVIVLIGTNDVGRNRPAAVIAEGIRASLQTLRSYVPTTRILLLGLLPRSQSPASSRRQQIQQVNQHIQKCQDGRYIFYSNPGIALLDRGDRLSAEISPDGVHLSPKGYEELTSQLRIRLDEILAGAKANIFEKSR